MACLNKARSGQTLVLVIIAMTISLAAGLAISSRSLSALKGTSFTTQSTAAYHAAEAGVEEALKWLADPTNSTNLINGSATRQNISGSLTGSSYIYSIAVGGGGTGFYRFRLDKDKTQEIKLNNSYSATTLEVCWALTGDTGEDASLEMFLISGDTASGYILSQKIGVNGSATYNTNGFELPPSGDVTYRHCRTVAWAAGEKVQLLRIKALYNNSSAVIKPSAALPAQSFVIGSVGTAGESRRKLEVTKSLPALPEIFDFAIFTTQDLTK